ncbi:MAG: AAA family ATPase [Actinobacteria bacterium]|nr:AAA family ATPase [Actinomycetota bacterium]
MAALVVIIGPIASGKSTVAAGVAQRLRDQGRRFALVDLDEVVAMAGGFVDLSPADFRKTQLVCGQLAGAWLRAGCDVIAHGPFFQSEEEAALLHAVPEGTATHRIRLDSTFETALERVARDPTRDQSKDPGFLRQTYDCVELLLPAMRQPDMVFDTTTTGWQQIVDDLAAALLRP